MSGASGDILPFPVSESTLANGLRLIVVPTGFPNLASLQIPVQTGSRNEVEPGKSGFAHFFEHMMFRGTERYPAAAYQEIVKRAGARQNAYTTDDYTNYHITFAGEDLETVLMLEADRFMHLAYSEADFRTEALAVLGEYNKNSANPLTKLFEAQRDRAYTVHPYRHTTMGFLRDIEDMPNQFDYARTFFDRWYRPEHTALIVAGDVAPDAVAALVERSWGAWRPGSHRVVIPPEPEPRAAVAVHVPWESATLPYVTVAFHGPAFSETERDYAALDLLLDLWFGRTSDLYRRLVEVEQTVDAFAVVAPPRADPSLATIVARAKRPEDVAAVRDAILETAALARRRPVPARRLAEARAHGRYAFVRALDNSESVAATLAQFVRFRRSAETLSALYRLYDSLTPDDLLAVAARYLRDERLVQTTLSHEPPPATLVAPPALPASPPARPARSRRWCVCRPPRRSSPSSCCSRPARPAIRSARRGWQSSVPP
ncbi:MAG: pitrilysin family protein [Dehalococcoidia bacterium]